MPLKSLTQIYVPNYCCFVRSAPKLPSPAATLTRTHRQLSDEQLREAGVAPDLVRLSVGIENVEDIIADLEQAMAKM